MIQFQICICWFLLIFFFWRPYKTAFFNVMPVFACRYEMQFLIVKTLIFFSTCDDSSFKNHCQLWCKILQYISVIRFFFSGYSSWSLELLSYSEVLLLENITSGTVLSTGTHFDLVYVGPCKCSNISVSEELSYDTVFIPILPI